MFFSAMVAVSTRSSISVFFSHGVQRVQEVVLVVFSAMVYSEYKK